MKTVLAPNATVAYPILTLAESQALTQPLIETIWLTEYVRAVTAGTDVFATRVIMAKAAYAAVPDPTIDTDLSYMWFADDYLRYEAGEEYDTRSFIRETRKINSSRRLKADDWDTVYVIHNGATSGGNLEFVMSTSILLSVGRK